MVAPIRMRLHRQVAGALEEVYAARLDEHASEMAAHLAHSPDPDDLARAMVFGERAAARALSVYAYGEAVRELDRALEIHDLVNSNDSRKKCDLLLSLAEALVAAGEQQRVLERVAPAALEFALAVDDRHRAFRACEAAMQAMRMQRGGAVFFTRDWATWTRRTDMYAEPGTLERIHADLELAHGRFAENDPQECWRLANRGLALARELQDHSAIIHAYEVLLSWPSLPQHERERQQLCLEFPERFVDELDTFVSAFDVWLVGANMLRWGLRSRTEDVWGALARWAARVRSAGVQLFQPVSSAMLATITGNLEEAVRAGQQLLGQADAYGTDELARRWAANSKRTALLYLGRGEEALAEVTPVTLGRAGPQNASGRSDAALAPEAALCFAHLGRRVEAQRALEAHRSTVPRNTFQETLSTNSLTWLLEAAVLVGSKPAARDFAERLSGAPAQISIAIGTAASGTCPARHLGAAAALLGDYEQALRCYGQALEAAGKIQFRPEIALTHLQIARLLLEPGDSVEADDAKQRLQFAIAELREMQMAPALQSALELAGRL
jgi:tetratricopeptide (TPR) repeat protein